MRLRTRIFVFLSLLNDTERRKMKKTHEKIALKWEVGFASTNSTLITDWHIANVPGAVQLDLAKALNYEPYYYAENWKDYEWMEDKYFCYRSHFDKPAIEQNQKCILISKGIDYEFEILINGICIFHQEGMFTAVKLDLKPFLIDKNELIVKIHPIPKLHKLPADRSQSAQSVKPTVSYGWDWHPRLVPVGIWDETYLSVLHESEIVEENLSYTLDNDLKRAFIRYNIFGKSIQECTCYWKISDATGKIVIEKKSIFTDDKIEFDDTINNVRLWWPHDQGKPYLYHSNLQLIDKYGDIIQQLHTKIGFRKVKLIMNEGAWNEPRNFPKSQSVAPIQLEINNRPVFCKGSNWVNPEIFPGIITEQRYEELIDKAIDANFNLLRVWGGGIVNKDAFYELCSAKGLMVWQEFPLACNYYESTPHYLKILEQESESIIKRLRIQPSVVIWCGGNELYNNWSKMTEQSLALRLLNSQCFKLDQNTPFLATSPVVGMGHGHYVFRDWNTKKEVFQWMRESKFTAYTEFGMPSPSSVDVLKTIIPSGELWPPKRGTSWQSHHAFKAWVDNTWLMPEMLTDYFGEAKSLEEMVENGQLVQSEGYKCIFEEARRQKPYCSMALNWCFNEPWPTAANNSLINWPNKPKPAFYAVKNACRPFLLSASLRKFKYTEGEEFLADIWVLNDLPHTSEKGKVSIKISTGKEEIKLLDWQFDSLSENTNLAGPTVRLILPSWETDRFKLLLEVENHTEFNSEYAFLYETLKLKKKKANLLNF